MNDQTPLEHFEPYAEGTTLEHYDDYHQAVHDGLIRPSEMRALARAVASIRVAAGHAARDYPWTDRKECERFALDLIALRLRDEARTGRPNGRALEGNLLTPIALIGKDRPEWLIPVARTEALCVFPAERDYELTGSQRQAIGRFVDGLEKRRAFALACCIGGE